MYKHILIPTDGSRISEEAAAAGIDLARSLGARVTALHVIPEPAAQPLEAWAHEDEDFREKLLEVFEKRGSLYLENVRDAARKAGVPCDIRLVRGESPHAEILVEAADRHCDLVFMASHGRKGTENPLLGSETVKVTTLGKIPVLVHHEGASR